MQFGPPFDAERVAAGADFMSARHSNHVPDRRDARDIAGPWPVVERKGTCLPLVSAGAHQMRVLFCVSETLVPPYNGFKLAVGALVEELRRTHDVRIIAPGSSGNADPAGDTRVVEYRRPGLSDNVVDLARSLFRHEPARVERLSRILAAPLREELASFRPHVVHVSHGELARVGRALGAQPAVLACLDAWHRNVQARIDLAAGPQRLQLQLQLRCIMRYAATEYGLFSHLTTVTPEDASALLALEPRLNITPIPNGVESAPIAPRPSSSDEPRLLFHGAMSFAPNVSAARYLATEILPIVQRTHPRARLDLVGRNPSREVHELGKLPGVHVSGEVASLAPWMASAHVYVCSMVSGTGIKNKLLEAFAYGVPCVSTPMALQGINAVHNRDVVVGATPGEVAEHVIALIANPARAAAIGDAGRELVRREHGWPAVAAAYEDVYEAAIDAKRG